MVFEELCLNMYHHIITEGYTMGNSSLVQQVLSNYMSRYGGTFAKAKNCILAQPSPRSLVEHGHPTAWPCSA